MKNEVIIKDTHRGLWYEDGVLKQVLAAGRYKIRPAVSFFRKQPRIALVVVDVRERELTIKGQEILASAWPEDQWPSRADARDRLDEPL